jgi:hypothetical protein
LLSLKKVLKGTISDSMTHLILEALIIGGGLGKEIMASGLVAFGVDGVLVFQNISTSVIMQLHNEYAPYMVGVHYMAHHTNLAMQTLINKLHFVHLG